MNGYWREGLISIAIPPTPTSDIVRQHSKIRGISFRMNEYFNVDMLICMNYAYLFDWHFKRYNKVDGN